MLRVPVSPVGPSGISVWEEVVVDCCAGWNKIVVI